MQSYWQLVFSACGLLLAALSLSAQPPTKSGAREGSVDEYIDHAVFAFNPTTATQAGVHGRDAKSNFRYFATARANLKNVPQIFAEIALEQLRPGKNRAANFLWGHSMTRL